MKNCPKCGKPHERRGAFCSRQCANSRRSDAMRQATARGWSQGRYAGVNFGREKQSASMKRFMAGLCEDERAAWIAKRGGKGATKAKATFAAKLMSSAFADLGARARRRRVILEQQGKCNRCGLSEWLGLPMVFELEHKDGDRRNNSRENLEALCPNCHSQTPTWRGKNGEGRKNLPDDVIVRSVAQAAGDIRAALRNLGLNDSLNGGSYRRAKKLVCMAS